MTRTLPSNKNQEASKMAWIKIGAQLILITCVVHYFQIEADLGFPEFWYLWLAMFVVNLIIPQNFRPILLFTTFVMTLTIFLGWLGATKVLMMCFFIIGLCHLPIKLIFRKIIVFGVGLVVGLMILGMVPSPFDTNQLRVIATIFMFRIILYLYELEYEKKPVPVWTRLNYFLLAPNIIFPLFPIVDYKKFQSGYYSENPVKTYQKGTNLITWSVLCLLIYRFIYHFGIPNIREIHGLADVLQYFIATYLTVFRLIGLLTLSIGVLHLFGFNLPRIFNNMFLASSFSDLFRRINIYWKEFLTKVIYYPVYFRLRKLTPDSALIISIMVTYFFTWFFHVYQWFWVLGSNPLRQNSLIFWGVFGVFATIAAFFNDTDRSKRQRHSLWAILIHTGKIMITFLSMSMLYSMWVNPTFDSWIRILVIALEDTKLAWSYFGMIVIVIWLTSGLGYYLYLNRLETKILRWPLQPMMNWSTSIVLIVISLYCYIQIDHNDDVADFKENRTLNERDDIDEFAGYYDEILKVKPDVASRLWGHGRMVEKRDRFQDMDFVRSVNNVMLNEFIPNATGQFKGEKISANQWGFRDKNYEREPSEGTIRIAVVGASPTMGSGVSDDEVFEQLVEGMLNDQFGNDTLRFEILNFAKSSISVYHHAYLIEEKIRYFEPDYVLDVEHCRPFLGFIRKLKRITDARVPMYPELDSLVKSVPIDPYTLKSDPEKEKMGKVLAKFGFNHFVKVCKKYNIQPVWVFVPAVSKSNLLDEYLAIAHDAGFDDFISLEGIYDNYNQKLLQVSESDRHPNAEGHRIIANALFKELVSYFGLEQNSVNSLPEGNN